MLQSHLSLNKVNKHQMDIIITQSRKTRQVRFHELLTNRTLFFIITGAIAALGHDFDNSIPLSIFPIKLDKYVFCFCGLPGRGKTHIARRVARYLEFFHALPVRTFNVAEYRRQLCGGLKDSVWFDPSNKDAVTMRNECNQAAVRDIVSFLTVENGVAILDSTNATHNRRANVKSMVSDNVVIRQVDRIEFDTIGH
jgi:hypothetical protein